VTRVSRNAQIQALYREVNERIASISLAWNVPSLELLCECGTAGCAERVTVRHDDYELLRARPTHFVLRHGHQDLGVEDVIKSADDYLIVANYGAAADIARSTDPRANSR
jgi:hypothetical protein